MTSPLVHTRNALWNIALVGNPNCGKTALFNLLTGARQKVANYAGVTVERKVGSATLRNGRTVSVIDLPGAYSLTPALTASLLDDSPCSHYLRSSWPAASGPA